MRAILKQAGMATLALTLAAGGPVCAQISNVGDAESVAEDLERAAEEPTSDVPDPWEGFNRKMFSTHLFLDHNILVPAAKAYRAVTPKKGRKGIRKFLHNARTPVILINDIFQGEWKRAGKTTSRFVINSTIGFLGFADPAAHMGIESHDEDFGQTLATWGVSSGPYLFLPLLGPSSIRDGFGAGVDLALDPLIWIRTDPAKYARYTRAGVTGMSVREPLIEPLEDIEEKSLDYYASLRSFYLQARKREINNGRTTYEDLPDIGEFEEFDELQ
ncbi:MAG: VacJ family lipoprotein [Parvularculaceae bacterium]